MYIAFQKSNGSLVDRIISCVTKSEIVHCELVSQKFEREDTVQFYGYSAYFDEGVRARWFKVPKDQWIFIKLNNVKVKQVKDFFEKTKGKKYDWLGILGFVFGNKDNPNRYFCSEWCAQALNFENPSKWSPAKLYNYFTYFSKD